MTDLAAQSIRTAAINFLRGDTSVVDFTYAYRAALGEVTADRPLHGVEIDLFDLLERWEAAGSEDRPAIVDELRVAIRLFSDDN